MFVDADDWVHFEILEKLVSEQKKNQSDVVVCNMYKVWNSRAIIKTKNKSHYFGKVKFFQGDEIRIQITEAYLHGHPFPAGLVAKLYKKELLNQSGNYLKYITFLGDNLHYNLEFFLKCGKVSTIPEALYYYRTGGNTSRYMKYHFDDIVSGYEIQKMVIEEYYKDSIQKRMNGVSIMLLNSFKTSLVNIHRGYSNKEALNRLIVEYCENPFLIESTLNEGSQKYFDFAYLEAIKNVDVDYLRELGYQLYLKSVKLNKFKKIISFFFITAKNLRNELQKLYALM